MTINYETLKDKSNENLMEIIKGLDQYIILLQNKIKGINSKFIICFKL